MNIKNIGLSVFLVFVALVAGCANVPGTVDIGDITLHPGDSSTCMDSPCTVYFVMPPGEGQMALWEDGPAGVWETGKFDAGTKVNLGGYWAGQTVFTVKDVDVPKAWLTVTGRR